MSVGATAVAQNNLRFVEHEEKRGETILAEVLLN
jgi:hypothetical protein